MQIDKALRRERKRQKRNKMIMDNRSVFLLEELSDKRIKKNTSKNKRRQREERIEENG